ncbi:hypothetical protein B0J17DRAFT_713255 [Rhizoctonia solani]|nr:hypothetical protein B0J17DRAFT_713255 [Rhizoctonia solani]
MPALDAAAEAESKWLTEALLERSDCENFRRLYDLRRHMRAMGVIPRFRSPPPDLAARRSEAMYRLLQSMDQGPEHPSGFARRTAWFLDIGSSQDGFARYILDHSNARGVGVTPPVDGGTGWAIPPDRFELHQLDLCDLVSRYLQSAPASRTWPFTRTSFDLVILDADTSSPRILLAQLLLALHTIHNGGQILLKLSCIERPQSVRVLLSFSRVADYISVSKPSGSPDGRFYLHAQMVRHNTPAYNKLKDNLKRLWNQIQSTHTQDPTWDEEDLITPWGDVLEKSNMDLVVKLGNPLWGTQLTALYRALGIGIDQPD